MIKIEINVGKITNIEQPNAMHMEVLEQIVLGNGHALIANNLGITIQAAVSRRRNLLGIFDVKNDTMLVYAAMNNGIIDLKII